MMNKELQAMFDIAVEAISSECERRDKPLLDIIGGHSVIDPDMPEDEIHFRHPRTGKLMGKITNIGKDAKS